jgi:hypothetical protein
LQQSQVRALAGGLHHCGQLGHARSYTPDGFAAVRGRVDAAAVRAGRMPGEVTATAAVLVSLPGGTGRLTGDVSSGPVRPVQGSPADISGHLEAMASASAAHLQLVVDPITIGSAEMLGEVLATLDRD